VTSFFRVTFPPYGLCQKTAFPYQPTGNLFDVTFSPYSSFSEIIDPGASESVLFNHSTALAESGDSLVSHRITVRFVTPSSTTANSFIVSFARFLARLSRAPSVSLMRLFLARNALTSR
jgi:hypothetical protein